MGSRPDGGGDGGGGHCSTYEVRVFVSAPGLGDVVENQVGNDAMAVRSRAWVDALGPVMPPDQAAALKAARPPPTAELYAKAERAR